MDEHGQGCGCQAQDDSCKEVYLAAYQCYLTHPKDPSRCLPLFKALKECYAAPPKPSWLAAWLAALGALLPTRTARR